MANDKKQRATELFELAKSNPEKVAGNIDEMLTLADSTNTEQRIRALQAISFISDDFPDRLVPKIEQLFDLINLFETPEVEYQILDSALWFIGEHHPDEIATHKEEIQNLLHSEVYGEVYVGVHVLSRLSETHPDVVLPFAERLSEIAANEDDPFRLFSLTTLNALARHDADAVLPYTDDIKLCLDTSDKSSKWAFYVLGWLGEEHPEVISGLEDLPLEALEDENESMRLTGLQLLPAVTQNIDSNERKPLSSVREPVIESLECDDNGMQRRAAIALTDITRITPEHLPTGGDKRLADAFETGVVESELELPDLEALYERIATE